MEHAALLKYGLLLEVIGFVMASFFIALLNINIIKKIAEKTKGGIHWVYIKISSNKNLVNSGKIIITKTYSSITKFNSSTTKSYFSTTSDNKKHQTKGSLIGFSPSYFSIGNKKWKIYHINKIKIWQFPILIIQYLLIGLILILFLCVSLIIISIFFLILLAIIFAILAIICIILSIILVFATPLLTFHYLIIDFIIFVSRKLAENGMISKLMIILGTIIVLIGLIIQLIAVW